MRDKFLKWKMFVIKRFEIYPLFFVNKEKLRSVQWSKRLELSKIFPTYEKAEECVKKIRKRFRIREDELSVMTYDEAREAKDEAEMSYKKFKQEDL